MAGPSLPSAGAVLDRYVQVTGGRAAWLSKHVETVELEGRTLDSARVVLRATVTTAKDGSNFTRLAVPEEAQEGIYKGTAWALTKLSGARIKHGLDREEAMRAAHLLEEVRWRVLYPRSRMEGMEDIEGHHTYRIALLPSPHRKIAWFDAASGLLVKRETVGTAADTYLVETWRTQDGVTQPSSLLANHNGFDYRLAVLSVQYNREQSFLYPDAVQTLLDEERAGRALPNAEELIERHIFASGGSGAYENIRTQRVTGTLEFVSRNLAAQTETLSAAGGRYYQAVDMPGFGKNEQGSNGKVAWERSPTLGPRARSRDNLSGLGLTIDAAEVVGWRYLLGSVRTEALEKLDGRDCYRVHIQMRSGADGGTRWYDRETRLLYRNSAPVKTEMGTVPTVLTYMEYAPVEGLQWPVRIHMEMAGQEMMFTARSVQLNQPIEDSAFGLPDDVRNLTCGDGGCASQ